MSETHLLNALLAMLKEACEGGEPGQSTGFVENTAADGSGNAGVLATLDDLTAAQASAATALGTSVASHAAHLAFHLEVTVRWAKGERGPFDWKGSFEPRAVDDAAWAATRGRVRAAYEALMAYARGVKQWDEDTAVGLAAAAVHVAYHLGAIRQIRKLAPRASTGRVHPDRTSAGHDESPTGSGAGASTV